MSSSMSSSVDILKKYQWKNRLILVFTPDFEDPRFERQQLMFFEEKENFRERDLLLFQIDQRVEQEDQLSKEDVLQLRKRFSVGESEFTVILIGKDGGEKLRKNAITDAEQIFSLIDSMPMRKAEMSSSPRNKN